MNESCFHVSQLIDSLTESYTKAELGELSDLSP